MEDKRIQVMTILQDYFCRDTPLDVATDSILRLFSVSNSTKVDNPKLSVKCLHCGRKFIGKMPHKCNTGYRKRNQSWQEVTED